MVRNIIRLLAGAALATATLAVTVAIGPDVHHYALGTGPDVHHYALTTSPDSLHHWA